MKIHVESGNIFHSNIDTNESIYNFYQQQEESSKAFINFDFLFGDSYSDYFEWLINKFKTKQDDNYHVLKNKNSKYIFYKFNDSLATIGELVKAIRHSKITQDDAVIQAIQNQNWQYFVETLLYGCSEGRNLTSFHENYKKSKAITNALQNITICKQIYNRFYKQISSNFEMTINNLPANEKQEINCDLQNLNYNTTVGEKNLNQFIDSSALDIFTDFFKTKADFQAHKIL